ncbi:hypothetical protein NIES4073_79170 [Kalymmatonema gypsitolerans NIES-4073]|nr:hypothetical protein NIES4073_79170 [Scytonema sp. NIES-4073]
MIVSSKITLFATTRLLSINQEPAPEVSFGFPLFGGSNAVYSWIKVVFLVFRFVRSKANPTANPTTSRQKAVFNRELAILECK